LGDVDLGRHAGEALGHDVAQHARARGGPAVAGAGDGLVHAGSAEAAHARLAPLGRALDNIDHHHGLASPILDVFRDPKVEWIGSRIWAMPSMVLRISSATRAVGSDWAIRLPLWPSWPPGPRSQPGSGQPAGPPAALPSGTCRTVQCRPWPRRPAS